MSGCPFEKAHYGCGCSAASGHYGGGGGMTASMKKIQQSVGVGKRRSAPKRRSYAAPKKRAPTKSRGYAAAPKSRAPKYFLRPDTMSAETKKYCRCLAEVGAKSCSGGVCSYTNPYAVCSRIKPAGMKGGCAMLYDYDNMPYAAKAGTAAMHNKTIKELVESARHEAEYLKQHA